MNEIILLVEDSLEAGLTARALGVSIFTEAYNWNRLCERVRDAVRCPFDDRSRPKVIRLHYVRQEVIEA